MSLSKITLQLARNPGLPGGDPSQGYTLIAPLTAEGQIDLDAWRETRAACRVVRFHPDPDERADGLLTHRGSHWFFHYDEDDEDMLEAGEDYSDLLDLPFKFIEYHPNDQYQSRSA